MLIRLYRATLSLYPADIRASLADEQTALFARLLREERPGGFWARMRWTGAMFMGSVRGALGVRRDRRRRGRVTAPRPFRRDPHWRLTMSDLRQVIRSLLQARWFTGAAILTFALGIGVNVAVFSVVDGVLFRELPYADPDELVVLGEFPAGGDRPYGTMGGTDVLAIAARHSAIVGMSVADWSSGRFTTSPEISAEAVIRLTPSSYTTLSVFGVRPILGRDFAEDDARGDARIALIGYDTWQHRFNGSPDVLGARLWSNRQPTEVIGVLPDGFIAASSQIDPLADGLVLEHTVLDASVSGQRTTPPFVRLRPGTTLETAQVELDAIAASLRASDEEPRTTSLRFIPVRALMFGYFGPAVWLVIAAAALVLLIASSNLAALLLVRGRSRERIAALQVALGASRGRLMASALLESGILAAAGAVVALLALVWTAAALQSLLPPLFAGYAASILDVRILGFAGLVLVASTLVAGGWPAWRIARVDPIGALRASGIGRSTSLRGSPAVIAVEAALTVMLVAGAALAGRTVVNLLQTDVGFEPGGLHQVLAHLPFDQPPDVRYRGSIGMLDVLRQHPGVTTAMGADVVPTVPAIANRFGGDYGSPAHRVRTTGRLAETMGLELMAGRDMSDADVEAGRHVGVLSRSALRLVWPDVEPAAAVGRQLEFEGEPAIEIIGVVSDAASSFSGRTMPTLYVPVGAESFRTLMFLARAEAGSLSVEGLRDRFVDAGYAPLSITLDEVSTMYVGRIRDQRFRAMLFSSFGAIGLMLAAIGIYALTAFEVARRHAEMGIRTALGARAGRLQRLVIAQALRPVVVGVAVGAVVSYWAAQFLQSFLHQVDARDPGTLAAAGAVVLFAAVAGAWMPARRASRVDPVVVLRAQ